MSLADFAGQIGISPATARQWKKRGKIVERDGVFILDAGVVAGAVTLSSDHQESVTGRDISVTAKWGPASPSNLIKVEANPETSVTERDGGVTRELAQDSRLCRREDSTCLANPESHLESCAGCEALRRDIAEMREWVNNLQHDFQRRLRALEGRPAPPQSLPHLTGESFQDGEGPVWGA